MPLGDSQTDGYAVPGAYRISLWEKLIESGVEVNFVGSLHNGMGRLGDPDHEGHNGYTIAEINRNVSGWLDAARPDVVLLLIGGNDVRQGDFTWQSAQSCFFQLLRHIESHVPGVPIVVGTFPQSAFTEINARVDQLNQSIRLVVADEIALGQPVSLVEIHDVIEQSDLGPDGIHPTITGFNKMGPLWYQGLKPLLNLP